MAKIIMAVCFMGLALPFPLWNGAQAADPGQPEAFAKEFVDAINSKNTGRRLALLHPKSRSCINARTQPLRAEVIALAREGRRIDAIKKYREASGEDLGTAKSVVDLLVPGEPRAE